MTGRSGGPNKGRGKSVVSIRPTGKIGLIEFKGDSPGPAHRDKARKENAVPAGIRSGVESLEKAANLRADYSLAARLDAIAAAIDPYCANLELINALVVLADEVSAAG